MQRDRNFLRIILIVTILIAINFSSTAFAFSIIIKNETSVSLRIDSLEDNCGNILIEDKNPVSLTPGGWIKFENVVPNIHRYWMCANGTCEGSALGMEICNEEYILVVRLIDGCIWVTRKPLFWPGVMKCNKPKYQI